MIQRLLFLLCERAPACRTLAVLVLAAGLLPIPLAARERVEVIAPTSPGNGPDLVARVIADILNAGDFQAVVRNVPGAAGEPGVRGLLRPEGGGITLLAAQSSIVAINPHVNERPEKELWKHAVPVLFIGRNRSNSVLVRDRSINSIGDHIEKKRKAGETLRYASLGIGSFPHLVFEEIFSRHGRVDRLHIPYKAATETIQGLLGGDLDIIISGTAALSLVASGRLHALAVVGERASPQQPGLPALARDYRGLTSTPWFGLFANPRIEAAQLQQVRRVLQAGLASEPYRERLAAAGIELETLGEAQFLAEMAREYEFFRQTVHRLKIDRMQ